MNNSPSDPLARLEAWASQSRGRVLGAPLVVSAMLTLLAIATGYTATLAAAGANGFVIFALYAFFHTWFSKTQRIPLWMSMAFLTTVITAVLNLLFLMLTVPAR